MKKQIVTMILLLCVVTGVVIVKTVPWGGAGKDKEQEVGKQLLVSGSIYEITENNFIEGLSHDFSPEELEIWNEVSQNNSIQEEQGRLLDGTQKYMINLYDSGGNEALEYMLDRNGQLYDGKQNGQAVSCFEITEMLERIIAENK